MPKLTLTSITPKNLPQSREYKKAIEAALLKAGRAAKRDYESTTRTWDHKPKFDLVVAESGGDLTVTVGTDDKIYGYVDRGTKPHVIRPKRSRFLRFSSGYRAKTRVGIIGSQPGGPFGDTVTATEVHHPGFPGRKFTATIRKRRQKTVEQETAQNIAKVARKQA